MMRTAPKAEDLRKADVGQKAAHGLSLPFVTTLAT
jgi:hypothetical protein